MATKKFFRGFELISLFFILNIIFYYFKSHHFSNQSDILERAKDNFPYSFIVGPLFFLHIRNKFYPLNTFVKSDLLHFLPLIVYLLFEASQINGAAGFQMNLFTKSISNDSFLSAVRSTQIIIYFFLSLKLMLHNLAIKVVHMPNDFLCSFIALMCLAVDAYFLPKVLDFFIEHYDVKFNLVMIFSAVIFVEIAVNIFLVKFPSISNAKLNELILENISNQLEEDEIEMITYSLSEYLESKPTRNMNFSKTQLMVDLKLKENSINYYFNNHLNISFSRWKCEQRIYDSKSLIENGFLLNRTIESLAREVGYSSRTRFVDAYIKIFNIRPSEYHKSLFEYKVESYQPSMFFK